MCMEVGRAAFVCLIVLLGTMEGWRLCGLRGISEALGPEFHSSRVSTPEGDTQRAGRPLPPPPRPPCAGGWRVERVAGSRPIRNEASCSFCTTNA